MFHVHNKSTEQALQKNIHNSPPSFGKIGEVTGQYFEPQELELEQKGWIQRCSPKKNWFNQQKWWFNQQKYQKWWFNQQKWRFNLI